MTENLLVQIEKIPESEGVFYFYGENKRLLFVGIAENIKKEINKIILRENTFSNNPTIVEIRFEKSIGKDLIKLFAETIRHKKPVFNISLSDEKLYPYLKITSEEYPRLLVTRRIKNDKADYFGAFLPETGVRFLLDFLDRTFRLRNCAILIDGNFPVPCTQFYEKLCVAPCVENICDKSAYIEFVQIARLFLADEREKLENFLQEKIESAAEVLEFETAKFWRDIFLNIGEIWKDKKFRLRLDDAIDSYEISENREEIFIYLVTQRGRKILGKRIFVFEKKLFFASESSLSQFFWQFYQFHAPKEIRVSSDFHKRKFLSETLSRRENREVKISVVKSNAKKITTQRAFNRAKFDFDFQRIKPSPDFKDLQNELKKQFKLKQLPKRIECFDAAHISGTNFVAAKSIWAKGEFLSDEYKFWVIEENNELKTLEKGIEKSFEAAQKSPDLILIDGGKAQLKAALRAVKKFNRREISFLAAVKPPRRHNEISHFINEEGEVFMMKPGSDAMQLMVHLRDEAHELANGVHRTLRDTSHFYELANILPDLTERERYSLLKKIGSIKSLKQTIQNDFVEMFGFDKGIKVYIALKGYDFNKNTALKSLIVPVRYDEPNGEANDLQPLRLRYKK